MATKSFLKDIKIQDKQLAHTFVEALGQAEISNSLIENNMPQFATKTHFIQIKLNELIEAIGEEKVKSILSSFVCPLNKDVEDFLRNKAIVFSARNFAKTNLVFWETDDKKAMELVGYYAIASKVICIDRGSVSSREARKLREHGIFNEKTNQYMVSAPLI